MQQQAQQQLHVLPALPRQLGQPARKQQQQAQRTLKTRPHSC
jgi:hypothetical protein